MKRVLILVCMGLVSMANAAMNITNGDFNDGYALGANISGWYSLTTGNFWDNAFWDAPTGEPLVNMSINPTTVTTPPVNPLAGSWFYQGIGTSDGASSLTIGFDWGIFMDPPGGLAGLTVRLYEDTTGTFAQANDLDVEGVLTLVDSQSLAMTVDNTGVNSIVIFDLSGVGAGNQLYLRFNNYNAGGGQFWTFADNVQILTPDYAIQPDPADGENEVEVDLSDRDIPNYLSWIAPPDPNIAEIKGYDIYLDPNSMKVSNRDIACQIADSTASDVTQYDPAVDFEEYTQYYWTVDTHYTRDDDPNLGTPNETIYTGSPLAPWIFETVDVTPVIESYDSVITTNALLPAVLSAVVTDGDSNLATAVFTLLDDDADFPAGATASLQNVNVEDLYAPSCELITDMPGTYKVKLTVADDDVQTADAEAIAQVVVYDDACAAAQAAPSWNGFNVMDSDMDCDVDLNDLAALALQWLDDRNLAAPETYPANPVYVPYATILNGDFELGNLDYVGWSDGAAITDVAPINGSYSVEWAGDGSDGLGWYIPVHANTTYTFKLTLLGGDANGEFGVRYNVGNNLHLEPLTGAPYASATPISFQFTTGPDDEGVNLDFWIWSSAAAAYKIDDVEITQP